MSSIQRHSGLDSFWARFISDLLKIIFSQYTESFVTILAAFLETTISGFSVLANTKVLRSSLVSSSCFQRQNLKSLSTPFAGFRCYAARFFPLKWTRYEGVTIKMINFIALLMRFSQFLRRNSPWFCWSNLIIYPRKRMTME